MSKGQLILVPTPISPEIDLDPVIFGQLEKAQDDPESLFALEEPKAGRRRWLKWGLKREKIEEFIYYNEHSRQDLSPQLVEKMKGGKTVYLMSDCGLPAFCDPGRRLVDACHHAGVRVKCLAFSNSVLMALALSGFIHEKFVFQGFLAREKDQRESELKSLSREPRTQVVMDTPYRLTKLLSELERHLSNRMCMIGMDLSKSTELILRGTPKQLLAKIPDDKREFVIVISAQ